MASLAAVALVGCMTSTASPKATSPSRMLDVAKYPTTPHVRNGRFTTPFKLDGGGLLVVPGAASYVPARSLASVRTQAWATTQIGPSQPYVVGLGSVTIRRQTRGVRQVRDLVAWVALAKSSDVYSCLNTTGGLRRARAHLPSPNWSAVVIGDAAGSPAVVYRSASIVCEALQRTSVETVTEVISTPWTLTSSGVVTRVPSCSSFIESDLNSSRTSTSFRYQVTIPEDTASPAMPGSRALPRCLPLGTTKSVNLSADPEALGVTPTSLHEPTGLLRQASPWPYRGSPNTSASAVVVRGVRRY